MQLLDSFEIFKSYLAYSIIFIENALMANLIPCVFDDAHSFHFNGEFAGVKIGNKWSLIDRRGNQITPCIYSYQQNQKTAVIIYVALALLFQPFIKVALGTTGWNIADVIVSIGLIASIFVKTGDTKKSK